MMKKRLPTICILFLSYSIFAQEPTASAIINRSKSAYAIIKTYFDSGKVVSSFYNISHPFSNAKLFKTSYSSGGLFNFEYYELGKSNSLYVINQSTNKVQSWWGITNETKVYSSLDAPLGAAAGVSSSLSTFIPKLLLSKKTSSKTLLDEMVEPKYNRKEFVNGTSCFVIEGKSVLENDVQLWISDKDFLIRKVITNNTANDLKVKSTFQFFPYQPATSNYQNLFVFRPNRQIEL